MLIILTFSVTLTVNTAAVNEVSFNNGEFSVNKSIKLTSNINHYSVRVKNEQGLIKEEFINITNIKTIKDENNELIAKIKKDYGFDLSYGTTETCWYSGTTCTILTDDNKANQAIKKLIPALNTFPPNFFKKFQGENGYRIVLFDDIPGNTAGLASYEIGDDNKMLLDVNTSFLGRVFYHETWHIMEKLLYMKNGWTDPFTEWDQYTSTSYGDTSNNSFTIYDYDSPIDKIFYISAYAKTNEREDRAELFADLMFRAYKHKYMNPGYGINEKAKYFTSIIRRVWTNVSGNYWERFITF